MGKVKLSWMDILVIVVLIALGLVFHNWYMIHPTVAEYAKIKNKQADPKSKGGGQMRDT